MNANSKFDRLGASDCCFIPSMFTRILHPYYYYYYNDNYTRIYICNITHHVLLCLQPKNKAYTYVIIQLSKD